MKKLYLITSAFIMAMIMVILCCVLVSTHKNDTENISALLAYKLKKDYCNWENFTDRKPSDIYISDYHGNFNGCEVVEIIVENQLVTYGFVHVQIAGYEFKLGGVSHLYVYKDGSFYSLSEAFSKGFITQYDLEKLHSIMNT